MRHCLQVGNNQEKNIPSKEVNSRSLEEYELWRINASKKKSSKWFMGIWFAFEKCSELESHLLPESSYLKSLSQKTKKQKKPKILYTHRNHLFWTCRRSISYFLKEFVSLVGLLVGFLFIFGFVFEKGCLCSCSGIDQPAWPWTGKRSACFCLLSAGIKDVTCHAQWP